MSNLLKSLGLLFFLVSCNSQSSINKNETPPSTTNAVTSSATNGANPKVLIETNMGNIEAELYADKAPLSVANFMQYVEQGKYNGTIFHRVMSDFMIQGGGLTPDMEQKPTFDPIKNEAGNGLKNNTGTLAMARTNVVDSATSQFFINVKDNDFLDHRDDTEMGFGYAVFGKVTSGMETVDKIKMVKTGDKSGQENVPLEPVIINSVKKL